jgi:hypothetical protein
MQTSEQIDKLAPALVASHKAMRGVGKSGDNTFDRYKYAKLEDYYRVAKAAMYDNGLVMMESCDAIQPVEGRVSDKGKAQHACYVSLTLRIIHDSGQWIEVSARGEGQDRADKATYKAITGARKYAVAMAMNLVTTDDPESDIWVGRDKGDSDSQGRPKPSSTPPVLVPSGGGSNYTPEMDI